MNPQVKNRMRSPDVVQAAHRLRSTPRKVAAVAVRYNYVNAAAKESLNSICISIWGFDFETFQNRRLL